MQYFAPKELHSTVDPQKITFFPLFRAALFCLAKRAGSMKTEQKNKILETISASEAYLLGKNNSTYESAMLNPQILFASKQLARDSPT